MGALMGLMTGGMDRSSGNMQDEDDPDCLDEQRQRHHERGSHGGFDRHGGGHNHRAAVSLPCLAWRSSHSDFRCIQMDALTLQLTDLDLSWNPLGDESAELIAELIEGYPIQELKLEHTEIGFFGVARIAAASKGCPDAPLKSAF